MLVCPPGVLPVLASHWSLGPPAGLWLAEAAPVSRGRAWHGRREAAAAPGRYQRRREARPEQQWQWSGSLEMIRWWLVTRWSGSCLCHRVMSPALCPGPGTGRGSPVVCVLSRTGRLAGWPGVHWWPARTHCWGIFVILSAVSLRSLATILACRQPVSKVKWICDYIRKPEKWSVKLNLWLYNNSLNLQFEMSAVGFNKEEKELDTLYIYKTLGYFKKP